MRDLSSLSRGDRFSWAHQRSGKTLTQIGAAIGCSQSALSQWIRGTTQTYDAELLHRFAQECGVRAEWLLWGEGEPLADSLTDIERRILAAVRVMETMAPYQVQAAMVMLEAASGHASAPPPPAAPQAPTAAPRPPGP